MSTRKERSARNRRAHAVERAAVLDPLDKPPMPERPELALIPWNKTELSDEARKAVGAALLDQYPRSQIARALGITIATLRRLIKQDAHLTDCVDAAKDNEEAELRDLLMGMARKGSEVAALFLLKSRHGYVDRPDGKAKGEPVRGGVLVLPAAPTLEEWEARAYENQRKWRERPTEELAALDLRTSTDLGDGMRMQRLLPGDRPN